MPDHEEIPMESVLLGWARDADVDSQRFTGDGIYERAGHWSRNCGAGSSPGHDGRASADTAARRHRRDPAPRRPHGTARAGDGPEQHPGSAGKIDYAVQD